MDKGRLVMVSTITAVLISIYIASTLDIFREEDKSESKYMQAFVELKVINNLRRSKLLNISKYSNLSVSNPTDKYWTVAFKQIADDLGPAKEYICNDKKPRGHEDKYDCNTQPFIINKRCLVYSFGIGYDWSFDDAMARLNCEVHSFDPRTDKRLECMSCFPIDEIVAENQPGGIIIQRHLDILKIDIERYESDVLRNILDEDLTPRIRQFLIEYHIFPDTPKRKIIEYQNIYERKKNAGFRRYSGGIQPDLYNKERGHLQAECESYV